MRNCFRIFPVILISRNGEIIFFFRNFFFCVCVYVRTLLSFSLRFHSQELRIFYEIVFLDTLFSCQLILYVIYLLTFISLSEFKVIRVYWMVQSQQSFLSTRVNWQTNPLPNLSYIYLRLNRISFTGIITVLIKSIATIRLRIFAGSFDHRKEFTTDQVNEELLIQYPTLRKP